MTIFNAIQNGGSLIDKFEWRTNVLQKRGNIGKDIVLGKRESAVFRALGKREFIGVRARRLMG